MGVKLFAFIWGLAEATLFFIVPDVLLTAVGLKNLKQGLLLCVYALAGALIGGLIIYYWGKYSPVNALATVEKVPAISTDLTHYVAIEMQDKGIWAILLGPLTGTPYKIYAAQAANTGISIWAFMLISIPARLLRFMLNTVLCHYLARIVNRAGVTTPSLYLLLGGWVLFYSVYFSLMPG